MAKGPLDHLNDRERYLIALGVFVEQFAYCECSLIVVLARLSGCDDPTSRAIFSGVRSDNARGYIRRILEARKEEMPAFLKRAFEQLAIISTVRNDLMHYGASAVGSDGAVRTISTEIAAMPGKARETPVTAEILTSLATDAETINAAIMLFHLTYHGVPVELLEGWNHLAQRPWHYRSPPQGNTRRKPRDGPKQKPRQKPSRK